MRSAAIAIVCLVLAVPTVATAEERGFAYGDTIVLPRITLDESDPDGVARCDYLIRGDAARFWFGYVIEIPAPYNDGLHAFTLTDGRMGGNQTLADFDVTFAPDMGSCNVPLANATRFFNPGDEHGVVPAGTRYALFTMRSDETPTATFFIEIPPLANG